MNDWSKFTKRITVNAAEECIYQALATQAGIESWFLRLSEFTKKDGEMREASEFVETGDKYLWAWHGWSDEINQKGEILGANGRDFLQFTFHDPMVVSIRILIDESTNIVELTQEKIAPDDDSRANYYVGCGVGWTFYLANLKSVLEGGLDLRNKNEKILSVVNS